MPAQRSSIDQSTISADEDFDSPPAGIGTDGRFRVVCIKCDKRLRVRVTHAGRIVKCPKCKSPVNVPVVLPDGTVVGNGASVSLDVPQLFKPRKPGAMIFYAIGDVVLFCVIGWLIGHAIWH